MKVEMLVEKLLTLGPFRILLIWIPYLWTRYCGQIGSKLVRFSKILGKCSGG